MKSVTLSMFVFQRHSFIKYQPQANTPLLNSEMLTMQTDPVQLLATANTMSPTVCPTQTIHSNIGVLVFQQREDGQR